MPVRIAVINYRAGNRRSVQTALRHLGAGSPEHLAARGIPVRLEREVA